ncbi:MAG: DUF6048 family protein [Cytophagaceae bacterium]|jgi:hypothetical protein|nr:DUF6048 family protein [Cytophagaceae bacterium]
MKTSKTLKYIFISFLLVQAVAVAWGQEKKPETAEWFPAQGFTLGVNLAGPVSSLLNSERKGFSFLTRISLMDKWNLYGEAGFENVNFDKPEYSYTSNGSFFKVGVERNMLKKSESGFIDQLLLGGSYGFSFQNHGASQFRVVNNYWNDYSGSFDSYLMSSHWIEISAGPRAELFKNFFMGWSLHIKAFLFRSNREIMTPYLMPGYGNGDNKINASFSYNIEYMIPWKKAKVVK